MRKFSLVVVAALALTLISGGGALAQGQPGSGAGPANMVIVQLNAENDSGQTGTATLTAIDSKTTREVVSLSNGIPEGQPDHIHLGTCEDLDPTPLSSLNRV